MPRIRYGFGKKKVITLLNNVHSCLDKGYDVSKSQFIATCSVLNKYYLIHHEEEFDISSYFSEKDYSLIAQYAIESIGGALSCDKETYFIKENLSFPEFIKSRHSIRNFADERVDTKRVQRAVLLANHCPSACNRQSSKVYLINKQDDVDKILSIQQGVLATADKIHQLLVVTSNRNYFFTSGERNQLFVDGGIFLESLLLCLHNEHIGACTLHWLLNYQHDKKIKSIVGLLDGEKVIALIAIGNIENAFKVPYLYRKGIDELLIVQE